MAEPQPKDRPARDLHGLYGHAYALDKDGKRTRTWQFVICGRPHPDYVLIQLYSWIDGGPTNLHLVPLSTMMLWDLYVSEEDWREAGDREFR